MGRIRTIKPEFWKHEVLSSLPEPTHMLAASLINYADDDGYFNANPGLIRAECSPLREPSVSIHDSLNSLSKIGYLRFGAVSDGRRYGHIVSFESHQRINRPTPSKIKDLDIVWDSSPTTHTQLTEPSLLEGKGREHGTGNGMEHGTSPAAQSHPEASLGDAKKVDPNLSIYAAYPRKEGKGAAMDAIAKSVVRLVRGEDPHPPMDKLDAQRFLMRRVLEYARSSAGTNPDKTKIPHPATWFNQKRYDDDQSNWNYAEVKRAPTSKSGQVLDDLRRSLEEDGYSLGLGEAGDTQAGESRQGNDGHLRGGFDGDGGDGCSLGAGITLLPPAS